MMQTGHLLDLININSWPLYLTDYFLEPLLDVILCLLSVFVVLGNMLVVCAIWHENQLHSVTNYLIASLAAADCLVGLIVMPFFIVSEIILGYWSFGPIWCDLYHSFDVLASTASIMNLCAISLDRYIAITNPIKYPSRMTPKRVALLIAFLWTCSSLISFPAIIWWRAVGKGPLQQIAQDQAQAHDANSMLSPVPALSELRSKPEAAQNLSSAASPSVGWPRAQAPQPGQPHPESLALPELRNSYGADQLERPLYPSSSMQQSPLRLVTTSQPPALAVQEDRRSTLLEFKSERQQESLADVRYRCVFTDDTYYLLFSSFVSFYGPLCVMLYAYYRIYKAAIKQTRFLKHGSKQVVVGKNKRSRRLKLTGDTLNSSARSAESRSEFCSSNLDYPGDPDGNGPARHLVLRAHRGGGASVKAAPLPLASQQQTALNNPSRQVNNSSHCYLATSSSLASRSTPAKAAEQHVKPPPLPPPSLMPLMSMNSDTSTDSSLYCLSKASTNNKPSEGCNLKVKSVINEELDRDHEQAHPSVALIGLEGSDATRPASALEALDRQTPATSPAGVRDTGLASVAAGIYQAIQQQAPCELSNGSGPAECSQRNHLGNLIESAQADLASKRLSFKKGTLGTPCYSVPLEPAQANIQGHVDGAAGTFSHKAAGQLDCNRVSASSEAGDLGEGSASGTTCRGQLIYYSDSDKLLQGMVDLTGMHYIDCSSSTSSNNAGKLQPSDSLRKAHHHQHEQNDTIKSISTCNDINKENMNNNSTNIDCERGQKANESTWRSCRYDFYHRKTRHRKAASEVSEASSVSITQPVSYQKGQLVGSARTTATVTTSIATTIANSSNICEQQDVSGSLHARGQSRSVGRKLTKLAKERKAAKTLGIVVGVFILCWLPFFVVNIIVALCGTSCIYKPHILMSIVTWLGWLNSAMNPVIYVCWSRDFRRAFRKVLCACRWTQSSMHKRDPRR